MKIDLSDLSTSSFIVIVTMGNWIQMTKMVLLFQYHSEWALNPSASENFFDILTIEMDNFYNRLKIERDL